MQGLILFTWASTRKAVTQCSQAPLGPKARYISFPKNTKARLRVLPYLMKMGLGKEEVDGDVIMEEPEVGYYASHRIATFRHNTIKPLLGINKKDPHIHRGSVN